MIQNNGEWMGYQNVTSDVRGYNLSNTNVTGPIFSATAPTTQTDTAQSPLVEGDLWVNTSDLENYPLLYRWQTVNSQLEWVAINNADQTTVDGILFADARWDTDGTTNPVSGAFPTITSLLVSDYLDLDAPDPALYPEGMLHLELYGEGELHASVILPSQKKTYLVHCELAQHAEKGMKAQLKVGGGDGDLPSIPALSAPVKLDFYKLDWQAVMWGGVLILVVSVLVFYGGRVLFLYYAKMNK
jgi:hypothetical protein